MRVAALLLAVLLLAPAVIQAQGCAMCYANAAAQSERGIQALNLGIVVLLIPTLAIFGGIFWMAYRLRGDLPSAARWRAPASADALGSPWAPEDVRPRRADSQNVLLPVALPRRGGRL